jgi:REP element-mobilizing transposase RayT
MVQRTMHTYSLVYIHVVFATWSRCPFLDPATRPELHAYMAGTARNLGFADVHVGGIEDHVHLVGCLNPACALSDVIGQLKKSSGDWLRKRIPMFRWQRGFGAFSVSPDRIRSVQRYVMRQEEHHHQRTFRAELEKLSSDLGISFDDLELM